MIKQISLILAIFVIGFTFVSAQTNSTQLANPGITPDSALYFLDLAIENLGLALTFNNQVKIEKELDIAEERLAEAREMALKNNLNAMAKAEEKHEETLTKIKSELNEIKGDNSTDELEKELEIEEQINDHGEKIKAVKKELKLEININGELTPEQKKLIDSLIASFEGKTGEVQIEINTEKQKTKKEIEDETGEDGDEIEDELQKELDIEDDNQIEIEVENGVAKVQAEINDTNQEFEMKFDSNYTDEQIMEQVINEIAKRYSISVEEVKKIGNVEFERDNENDAEKAEDIENEQEGQNGLDEDNKNNNANTELDKSSKESSDNE